MPLLIRVLYAPRDYEKVLNTSSNHSGRCALPFHDSEHGSSEYSYIEIYVLQYITLTIKYIKRRLKALLPKTH